LKFAYITTSPFPSEKANIIQSIEVAGALADMGNEVHFYCPESERDRCATDDPIQKFKEFNGSEISFKPIFSHAVMPNRRFGGALTIPHLLKAIERSDQYDYYYVRNPYLLSVLIRMGKKVIFEQHQWESYRNSCFSELVRKITLNFNFGKTNKLPSIYLYFECAQKQMGSERNSQWQSHGRT